MKKKKRNEEGDREGAGRREEGVVGLGNYVTPKIRVKYIALTKGFNLGLQLARAGDKERESEQARGAELIRRWLSRGAPRQRAGNPLAALFRAWH